MNRGSCFATLVALLRLIILVGDYTLKKSKQIALCGMLAALILTMMFLGSVIWAFTYIAPLMSSLIMMIICDITGKKNALITFAAVSIISLIFLPDKECALTYAFFFGYYVIIKDFIEKIKPKALCILIKYIIYNAGIISSQLLLIYAFGIPLDNPWGKWGIVILILLANLVFFFYSFMLKRMEILYRVKFRSRIEKMMK